MPHAESTQSQAIARSAPKANRQDRHRSVALLQLLVGALMTVVMGRIARSRRRTAMASHKSDPCSQEKIPANPNHQPMLIALPCSDIVAKKRTRRPPKHERRQAKLQQIHGLITDIEHILGGPTTTAASTASRLRSAAVESFAAGAIAAADHDLDIQTLRNSCPTISSLLVGSEDVSEVCDRITTPLPPLLQGRIRRTLGRWVRVPKDRFAAIFGVPSAVHDLTVALLDYHESRY